MKIQTYCRPEITYNQMINVQYLVCLLCDTNSNRYVQCKPQINILHKNHHCALVKQKIMCTTFTTHIHPSIQHTFNYNMYACKHACITRKPTTACFKQSQYLFLHSCRHTAWNCKNTDDMKYNPDKQHCSSDMRALRRVKVAGDGWAVSLSYTASQTNTITKTMHQKLEIWSCIPGFCLYLITSLLIFTILYQFNTSWQQLSTTKLFTFYCSHCFRCFLWKARLWRGEYFSSLMN